MIFLKRLGLRDAFHMLVHKMVLPCIRRKAFSLTPAGRPLQRATADHRTLVLVLVQPLAPYPLAGLEWRRLRRRLRRYNDDSGK